MLVCRDRIRQALGDALRQLIYFDSYLLQHDVNERAITHKLGEYLQRIFSTFNVDCEYNRNMDEPKRVDAVVRDLPPHILVTNAGDSQAITVYPDIIVHRRGSNDDNLLVVEMKKINGGDPQLDQAKLRGFSRHPYNYQHAALVMVGWNTGPCVAIKWMVNRPSTLELKFEEEIIAGPDS